ncbi:MAG TPA: DUF445 family protein [Flavitalea sp.]|nr:DUF445 family protein [Flavitalea sp.]
MRFFITARFDLSLQPQKNILMNFWLLLIPIISAFIGWFTNWIAIKMLFHPREPKRILGVVFHGIFPKRQQQFAEKLGKLVGQELLSFHDIREKIISPENLQSVMPVIDFHIDDFLRNKLVKAMPMIAMFVGDKTVNELKGIFLKEMEVIFPDVLDKYVGSLQQQLDLEKIVAEKVGSFSSDKLEGILQAIMSREFKFVEIIGGVLGFIIGLIQVLITVLTT